MPQTTSKCYWNPARSVPCSSRSSGPLILGDRLRGPGALPHPAAARPCAGSGRSMTASRPPRGRRARGAGRGARALSGFESGVVALADGHGALYPHLAEAPFGVAFSQLSSEELASMATWVDEGTSSYTVGDTAGRGFVGHEVLRRSGVGSLVVLPLSVAGERLGLIVVADRANRQPVNEDVELLELLALQAASGLRMASMITRPRERVTRDPLTGLRASLPPLPDQTGVVLVDVDRLADVNDVGGQAAGDDVLRATAGLLRELMPPGSQAFRIGSDEFVRHARPPPRVGGRARRLGTALAGAAAHRPDRLRGRRGRRRRRVGRGGRAARRRGARRGQARGRRRRVRGVNVKTAGEGGGGYRRPLRVGLAAARRVPPAFRPRSWSRLTVKVRAPERVGDRFGRISFATALLDHNRHGRVGASVGVRQKSCL